jgi:hypothetical protein
MAILGIDLDSKTLRWVEVHSGGASHEAGASGRIVLTATRDVDAIRRFAVALQDVLAEIAPTKIAIREKPETGRIRAGAASLKMEAIILSLASVPVAFIGGSAINKCQESHPRLKEVDVPAFKAAVCAAA